MLYCLCEYKLRSWPYCLNLDSENSLLGNPLCTKLFVFIANHFEKLQCILHLGNLEMDFNQDKLVHCCLEKKKKICTVPWNRVVGCLQLFSLIKDLGVQNVGQILFTGLPCVVAHSLRSSGLTQKLPSYGTCIYLSWNMS